MKREVRKEILDKELSPLQYKYEIKWGCCDGRRGHYVAYSVLDIRSLIDQDDLLDDYEKDTLKFGYFHQFTDDITTDHICIDNGFDVYWYKTRVFLDDEYEEGRHAILCYTNLRKSFKEILLNPILGDKYYNLATDTYNCDIECCKDLKSAYDNLKTTAKMYKHISIGVSILTLLYVVITAFN